MHLIERDGRETGGNVGKWLFGRRFKEIFVSWHEIKKFILSWEDKGQEKWELYYEHLCGQLDYPDGKLIESTEDGGLRIHQWSTHIYL